MIVLSGERERKVAMCEDSVDVRAVVVLDGCDMLDCARTAIQLSMAGSELEGEGEETKEIVLKNVQLCENPVESRAGTTRDGQHDPDGLSPQRPDDG